MNKKSNKARAKAKRARVIKISITNRLIEEKDLAMEEE